MEEIREISCDNFPTDSTSSSISGGIGKVPPKASEEASPSCISTLLSSTSTTSSIISAAYFDEPCLIHKPKRGKPPNIAYELSIAKSALKQYSTLSGDNLFDHLSDIIKRVIDERPPNVIDFFEEFSRNVREQKFHQPERFPPDAVFEETRFYRVAKKILMSMKLPYPPDSLDRVSDNYEEIEEEKALSIIEDLKLDLQDNFKTFRIMNKRVQQLQFYWNQCGFTIATDDIFQLACSMDRLQNHHSISQCRFWGFMNGLKSPYYIVEALLTSTEGNTRIEMIQDELRRKKEIDLTALRAGKKNMLSTLIGPELLPGNYGWESWPKEELAKMQPSVAPIPIIEIPDIFDVPPEPVGSGVNRFSYFVVNALSDEWMELPIATPKQIFISRQIKKFFTGDLEAEVHSYPCFPGREKHLLRAIIARITAGTCIAPRSYYRKMTKRERRIAEGDDFDEDEEEEEEEEDVEGEGDEAEDNDILLLLNEFYEPPALETLAALSNWVHVRPYILKQGRVVYFDVEKARRQREKELARILKMRFAEEMDEEEEEEDEDVDGENEGEEIPYEETREYGPPLLTSIVNDNNMEGIKPWVTRFTSTYTNKMERVLVLQSNTWPGAYSFTFEKTTESIYMGWGNKYAARNMPFVHIPPITGEYPHSKDDFKEANDPSVLEEEEYRQYLLRKQRQLKAIKKFQFGMEEGLSEMSEEGMTE